MTRIEQIKVHKSATYTHGAPVIITATALLVDKISNRYYAQVKFLNITNATLANVAIKVEPKTVTGKASAIEHLYPSVHLRPGEYFGTKTPVPLNNDQVIDFKAEAIYAEYENGQKWQAPEDAVQSDLPPIIPLSDAGYDSKDVKEYRSFLGPEAKYVPRELDCGPWLCACGNYLAPSLETCPSCHSKKADVLVATEEQTLVQWAERRRLTRQKEQDKARAEEEASVLKKGSELAEKGDLSSLREALNLYSSIPDNETAENRAAEVKSSIDSLEKARRGKAKKIAAALAGSVVAVTIIALLVTEVAIPMYKYNSAINMAKNGNYPNAIAAFEELAGYRDSQQKVQETANEAAEQALRANDYQGAIDWYRQVGDDEGAVSAALKAGSEFESEGDYESAIKWYETAGDTEKANAAANNAGEKAQSAGDYKSAADWFSRAGNSESANETKYLYVADNYNATDETTYRYLSSLKDEGYRDSAELYANLYKISIRLIINSSNDDIETSLTTFGSRSGRVYGHAYVEGGYLGTTAPLEYDLLNESTWGLDGVVRDDYSKRRKTSTISLQRGWNTVGIGDQGSNVYDHRISILDKETGEVLASAEIHTPYSY